ncbi:RNA polymerase sigma factor [Phycisphaerales bacterium AB-hyl4]|uniref:RNA polymerase sigma factor n=1 Tax=Natronomicrosphaera hydrolytica TaxID=3242702 RepID=A0ABV4UAG4_9BACT
MGVNGHGNGDFPTTHWSFVRRAGEAGPDNDALIEFLKRYLPAMHAYLVRAHRLSIDAADDLLQEFVLEKVIRQELVAHADQRRGRFRTFLLTVLNNFLATQWRKQTTHRRSPGQQILSLQDAMDRPRDNSEAADIFDLEWARQVLAETTKRFESQCQHENRTDLWRLFEARVLLPLTDDTPPPPYEQLVEQLNLRSPAQASNILITAKRCFARQLRLVIGEYTQDGQEIQEEIRHLRQILAASRHRWAWTAAQPVEQPS